MSNLIGPQQLLEAIQHELVAHRVMLGYLAGTIEGIGGPTRAELSAGMQSLVLPEPIAERVKALAEEIGYQGPRLVDGGKT